MREDAKGVSLEQFFVVFRGWRAFYAVFQELNPQIEKLAVNNAYFSYKNGSSVIISVVYNYFRGLSGPADLFFDY